MNNVPVHVSSDIPALLEQRVREMFGDPSGRQFQVNPKTLKIHQRLQAGKNSYTFHVYENPTGDHPLDIKLPRNSAFVVFNMGLYLKKEGSTAGSENYGNYPLFTFPDPNYFVGNDATNPEEWEALLTIYHGSTTFKTKPVDRLDKLANLHFLNIPEKSTILVTAPMVNAEFAQYGPSLEEKGLFRLPKGIILDGADDNQIQLDLASGNTTVIAGGINASNVAVATRNTVCYLLHGFEVVNGARKVNQY